MGLPLGSGPEPGILSKSARAGIKAAALLARHGQRLSAAQVASQAVLDIDLARSVLDDLCQCGLVYRAGTMFGLAASQEAISIAQIIRATDKASATESCSNIFSSGRCAHCQDGALCAVGSFTQHMASGIRAVLDNYSLAEAIAEEPSLV
jgi:DNA-binding IscR family transcriptional regulator